MRYIAGVDIGNSTTEVCIGQLSADQRVSFLASASCPTTGTKGTVANIHAIKAALKGAMSKIGRDISDLSLIRLNEAAPVIGDTAMETLFAYHFKFHMTGTDTMMFKKEYLMKIGGFAPIDVGDEFYLMQRAIEGGGKFGYLPCCDIKAYIHTGENGGVSSGEGKVKGEKALFEHKKQYFDKIDRKSKRFIKMRYYAVVAFAYLRMKKYFSTFKYCLKSFVTAPIQCTKLFVGRKI